MFACPYIAVFGEVSRNTELRGEHKYWCYVIRYWHWKLEIDPSINPNGRKR